MMSQRIERTWIRTGSYRRFRGEWVNLVDKIVGILYIIFNVFLCTVVVFLVNGKIK